MTSWTTKDDLLKACRIRILVQQEQRSACAWATRTGLGKRSLGKRPGSARVFWSGRTAGIHGGPRARRRDLCLSLGRPPPGRKRAANGWRPPPPRGIFAAGRELPPALLLCPRRALGRSILLAGSGRGAAENPAGRERERGTFSSPRAAEGRGSNQSLHFHEGVPVPIQSHPSLEKPPPGDLIAGGRPLIPVRTPIYRAYRGPQRASPDRAEEEGPEGRGCGEGPG